MALTDFVPALPAVERSYFGMVEERVLTDAGPELLARVAAARAITVLEDATLDDGEIRRVGDTWRCSPRRARELISILLHR